MTSSTPMLAVYDFRSKQEFIYRTNRMREITGASELIAGMYKKLLSPSTAGLKIRNDWDKPNPMPLFHDDGTPALADDEEGAVVYEGGGNLLVLYRNWQTYLAANKSFSRRVIEESYSLCMIVGGVEWEHSPDSSKTSSFEWNRTRAYEQLDRCKRIGDASVPCNVLPYTQVDRTSFQPIVKKDDKDYGDITEEGLRKRRAFDALPEDRKNEGKFIDDLGTEHGKDSLIAVLYFDGNSIGERVKSAVEEGVAQGLSDIDAMRRFSIDLHRKLVDNTRDAMIDAINRAAREHGNKFGGQRIIIDHGDEITLICNAHAAPFALDAYFSKLQGTGYHACGGVAFCHTHDPFAEVYRIAEECCESGKKANRSIQRNAMEGLMGKEALRASREADENYIDMHFCRSGITGTLEQIRDAQEAEFTARPYQVESSYATFLRVGEALAHSKISRSDIKQLNRSILRGESWYILEYERLKAKDPNLFDEIEWLAGEREDAKRILFDVSSLYDVYDLRFGCKDRCFSGETKEDA